MKGSNIDRRNGVIGSLLFHGVVLIILIFGGLTFVQNEEEEGVLVNFGSVNAAKGEFEPDRVDEPSPEPVQPSQPQAMSTPQAAPEAVTTQDDEESLAMRQAEKKKREEESKAKKEANDKIKQEADAREKRRREEQAELQRKVEEQKRIEAINKRASGAFASGSSATSQGDAESGTGNQGSPFGNSNTGANEGVGGYGTVALSGRSLRGQLPRPAYKVQEEGKIVVNITVDKEGNVIVAEIGRGTDIDNQQLRNSALSAAKQAKFNGISANNNQSGSITYKFNLR